MDHGQLIRISKFLSLILRHKPYLIDLELDKNGWAGTEELIRLINEKKFRITFDQLKYVVDHDEKSRYSFSEDFLKMRANQGHSIEIDNFFRETSPPDQLFHGTAEKNISSIRQKGILKGRRHHVHLSPDKETAVNVGKRYGKPVVLTIQAGKMSDDGFKFYLSENNVWLTDFVGADYILFPGI